MSLQHYGILLIRKYLKCGKAKRKWIEPNERKVGISFFCCVSSERMRGNDLKTLREVQIRKYSWCCASVWPCDAGVSPALWLYPTAQCSSTGFPIRTSSFRRKSKVCAVPFHLFLLILTGLIFKSDRDKQQQRGVGCADGDSISKSSSPWYFLLSALSRCVCAAFQNSYFHGQEIDTGYQMWFLLYLWLSSYGFLLWF